MKILIGLFFALNTAFAGTQSIIPKVDIIEGQNTAKNYLGAGGHFEKSVRNYSNATIAYADTAGTSPADGTGGSPTLTCTRTTTTPIFGEGSLLITKDGVNRQGEGCGIAFSIDSGDKAKVLSVNFDFIVASGTFAEGTSTTDSDITVWVYDVTNAVVIQPSSIKLLSSDTAISGTFQAEFAAASNSTSYRLIFHAGTTSAAAYGLEIDDIKVSRSTYVYGTTISDWALYTPATQGFGTITSAFFLWRQVADSVEIKGKFTTGTTTAATAQVALPNAWVISSTKVTTITKVGEWSRDANTAYNVGNVLAAPSATVLNFGRANAGGAAIGTGQLAAQLATDIVGSSQVVSFYATAIPVQGLSSNQMAARAEQTDYGRTAYTPTFTGFGTVSAVSCYHWRISENLHVDCRFTSGTATAVEGRVSFPNSLVSSALMPAVSIAGYGVGAFVGAAQYVILREPSVAYFTFGQQGAALSGLTKLNGSAHLGSGNSLSFQAVVPISTWFPNQRAPTLLGSVTSNSTVSERIERIFITNTAGVPSITRQSGSFATSITDGGTGVWTVVIRNAFSEAPVCTCSATGTNVVCVVGVGVTTTSIPLFVYTGNTAAAVDSSLYITCMGPR